MSLINCPSCGAEMSLDVALTHEELRRAVHEVLAMSLPLGTLVMRYIALFKPEKNRLAPSRMAKLVLQLLPDMQAATITHKGRAWHMPAESWKLGLEAMLNKAAAGKLGLPLENHNYLYTVLVGLADRAEAAEEASTEAAARTRPSAPTAGPQTLAEVARQATALAADMKAFNASRPQPGTSPAVRAMRAQVAAAKAQRNPETKPESDNP